MIHAEASIGISGSIPLFSFPHAPPRVSVDTSHTDPEVAKAYDEAIRLFTLHIGASGAYARRALEIVLDRVGYKANSLDAAIKAAGSETSPENMLPPRLISSLGYIREVGNFAVHARRDDELAIVEMDEPQVSVCLEVLEELIEFLYEQPARHRDQVVKLNQQLLASNKKVLPLPHLLWEPPLDAPLASPE